MTRRITLQSLKLTKEQFETLYQSKKYKELIELWGISEDSIRKIAKDLKIIKKRIYDEDSRKSASISVKKYINNLSDEEKTYLKKGNTRHGGFSNHLRYCKENNIKPLFDMNTYENKGCPVNLRWKCLKCNKIINLRRSTTTVYPVCKVCNPSIKNKLQQEITSFVRESYDLDILTDNRHIIKPLEIDIVIPNISLGIEVNGLLYHSEGYVDKRFNQIPKRIDSRYHLNKTEKCEENGIHLFHILENEWYYKRTRQIWKSMIRSKLGKNTRIYGRKCTIVDMSSPKYNEIHRDFINKNHLQGYCKSSIKIGLLYNNELISLLTFRKHQKYQWEIARYCSKSGYNVLGGFSKMMKFFERNYNPGIILTFADRRYSRGDVYEKYGFERVTNTPPNYKWFKFGSNILESRQKYQKHKMKDISDFSFDSNLTEYENMFKNGYRRIFDSGNIKFIKTYK